jgi:hypothetical protein
LKIKGFTFYRVAMLGFQGGKAARESGKSQYLAVLSGRALTVSVMGGLLAQCSFGKAA